MQFKVFLTKKVHYAIFELFCSLLTSHLMTYMNWRKLGGGITAP